MDNAEEFGYFAKTVSERIKVSKDTLRNWSLRLESDGVEFERNARGQRIYYEKDIRAFENMKELLDLQRPLNDVCKVIADKIEKGSYNKAKTENNTEITPSVSREDNALITQEKQMRKFKNELLQEFAEQQKAMMEQYKKEIALEMADVMQDRFENAVEEAVKMKLLTEKKQEETAATVEMSKKKNWWQKFFG